MKNRTEHKFSRIARITCATRASSFYETEDCLKTDEYIAPQLLPRLMVLLLKTKIMRKIFESMSPVGTYEQVIARTKYIDNLTQELLRKDVNQIVLLGAGFDSRALGFNTGNSRDNQKWKHYVLVHTLELFKSTCYYLFPLITVPFSSLNILSVYCLSV